MPSDSVVPHQAEEGLKGNALQCALCMFTEINKSRTKRVGALVEAGSAAKQDDMSGEALGAV